MEFYSSGTTEHGAAAALMGNSKDPGCDLNNCANKTTDSDANTAKLTEETATATTESKKSRNRRKRQ